MKKILFLFVGCLLFFACKDAEPDVYQGESMLNFNKGVAGDGFVLNSQTYTDYKINYGSIKAVEGNHQVKLLFDASQSDAVLGTDFEILNNGVDELTTGEVGGEFTIRIHKAPATQAGKKAVFKLQSPTLPNAGFDQVFTLNMALTCPVEDFVGMFSNTETWWYDTPGGLFEIKKVNGEDKLIIEDFFDIGYDLTLNYNPTTFALSVPEGQETGYIHPSYGMIKVKSSTDAALVSNFNPCTRKLTVYMNYYVPAGTFGNQKEVFQGL